jgi:hypothetical protein
MYLLLFGVHCTKISCVRKIVVFIKNVASHIVLYCIVCEELVVRALYYRCIYFSQNGRYSIAKKA